MAERNTPLPGPHGSRRPRLEDLFAGVEPVRSAGDLARDGIFDDDELEEFLADLYASRRANVG